jgi:hypothetical protein
MYQLRGKNLADIVAIYVRGRELYRPPTYFNVKICDVLMYICCALVGAIKYSVSQDARCNSENRRDLIFVIFYPL